MEEKKIMLSDRDMKKTAFAIIMNLEVVHEAIQDVGSTGYKQ